MVRQNPAPQITSRKTRCEARSKVSLLGDFEEGFLQELGEQTNAATKNKLAADSERIFLSADSQKELAQGLKLAKSLKGAAAVWIVYPMGRQDITEKDIVTPVRKTGLKDVEVAV